MTEIDALREEIAKLRERVAALEARPYPPVSLMQFGGPPRQAGDQTPPMQWPNLPACAPITAGVL